MNIHLIFGFLGSGKTTLINCFLRQIEGRNRTAIIVNEQGAVVVDGSILHAKGIYLAELNAGCLCCASRGTLLLALQDLKNRADIEHVIVEASGIARPSDLLDLLTQASQNGHLTIAPIVTVVDVSRMSELEEMLGDFFMEQIAMAGLIVANKVDLVSPTQLFAVMQRIRSLNPGAQTVFSEQARIPLDAIDLAVPI